MISEFDAHGNSFKFLAHSVTTSNVGIFIAYNSII